MGFAANIVAGVALVLIASARGPGMSPDSVAYASMARSFARSGELIPYFSETPVTIWPPGLPLLLGFLLSIGISTPTAAIVLNIGCFITCLALTYLLADRVLRSQRWALLVVTVVGVSGSTINLFNMMWSEPLFTVFIVLTLLLLIVLIQGRAPRRSAVVVLLGMCCAVSAACLVRFVGITLIPVVVLGVYLSTRRRGHGVVRAAFTGLVVGGLSSTGFLIVAIRNISLGAPPLGSRLPSKTDLEGVVIHTFRGLGQFIFTDSSWHDAQLTAGIVIVGIVIYGASTALRHASHELYVILAFPAVWWTALFYSELTTYLDAISMRLAYPAFIPMVILSAVGMRRLFQGEVGEPRHGRVYWLARRAGVVLVTTAVVALMVGISIAGAKERAENGYRYSRPVSLASPLAAAVARLPHDARVASNDSAKVYWDSAHRPVFRFYLSAGEVTSARLAAAAAGSMKSHEIDYIALYTRRDVRLGRGCTSRGVRLEIVSTFHEGVLLKTSWCR